MIIRKATTEDREGIVDCLTTAFEPYRNDYTPEAFEVVVGIERIERIERPMGIERIDAMMPHLIVLVAVVQGKLVGMISYEASSVPCVDGSMFDKDGGPIFRDSFRSTLVGYIHVLVVHPLYLGRGTAALLLRAAEDDLFVRKCKWISLHTHEPLKRAQRFFAKHGYSSTGNDNDYLGMRWVELEKPF
jgi:ribosomal protein S18 acetylase RimI-like enzyme